MITTLLISLAVFLFINLFGYCTHRWLHSKYSWKFGDSHMAHHQKLYPVEDFTSDEYRSAGKDSTLLFFIVVAIPIIAVPIVLCFLGIVSILTTILSIVQMIFWGWLHNYMHDAFHLNNHILSKIPLVKIWFEHLKKIHFIHHVGDMKKNYGIFSFLFDRLFGSYQKP